MTRRVALLVGGILAVVAIAVPVLSDTGWREIAGHRITAGDRVDFHLRYRGTEGVLIESRGGAVERTSSCAGHTFVESYGDPPHTITRETASNSECFEWATGSLLGFGKLRSAASHAEAGVAVDSRQGIRLTGLPSTFDWSEVIIDEATDLPLRAVYRDGTAIEWHYDYLERPADGAVGVPAQPASPDELYMTVTKAEAAAGVGLGKTAPDAIADLRLQTAFAYSGGLLSKPRYYIIWTNARGGQIQLVVSPGAIPDDTPVVEELGGGAVSLNVQEGDVHCQIFASDMSLLRDAVAALRPEYQSKLP